MPFDLPESSNTTLMWVAVIFVALLTLAVIMELIRQRFTRRRIQAVAWQNARDIAREKGVSDGDWAYMQDLIQRCTPHDPMRAVSVRFDFGDCVAAEMEQLWAAGNLDAYAKAGARLRELRYSFGMDYVPFGQRIRSTRELLPAQVLWLAHGERQRSGWVRGAVVDLDEAFLHIALPRDQADPFLQMGRGEAVRCRMWREDDARYAFSLDFVKAEADVSQLALRHSIDLERVQSREHYRVRYNRPAVVSVINMPPGDSMKDLGARKPVTRLHGEFASLSAGGMAVIVPQPVPRNVILRVSLDLEGEEAFDAHARVVSAAALVPSRHLIRCAFVELDKELRDRIAQYVWHRQQVGLHRDHHE